MSIKYNGKIIAGGYVPNSASESKEGIVRIATDEEVSLGMSDESVITPKLLKKYNMKFNIFDTRILDYKLSYENSFGWALQGTYVYKTPIIGERYGYPDFYNKCLEEYNEATTSETVNNATINVHSNGHKFYNIADKEAIDTFFNTMGSAWFYGIDTENECIFLPRNNYFDQMTDDIAEVGKSIEAGLPTLTTNSTGAHTHTRGTMNITGVLYSVRGSDGVSSSEGALYNTAGANNGANSSANAACKDIRFDASRNWTGETSSNGAHTHTITGTADTVQPPAVKKLLYICVGNTLSDVSWIDVATQVEGGIKELEDKTQECIGEIKDYVDTSKGELKESIKDLKVITTLEIGDIGIAPLGIDETKGKRRYLNGQVIIQEQYVQFTNKVKSAVALYPSLACTESEWQTISTMTVNGQVGKFVVDDEAGTIRLPKIIMPIQGLTDLSKLGEIVEAGLPNITGKYVMAWNDNAPTFTDGCIVKSDGSTSTSITSGSAYSYTGPASINASRSSSIYGKSTTVQQEQIQYPYFIQVATGAETEDNIINEIELNNPYSFGDSKYSPVALNNLSWLKSEGQWNSKAVYPAYYDWALTNFNNGVEGFALSTGEYTDYDVVINPADETFRLPLLNGSESLPSDRYENLTLLATGNKYTATANGFVFLSRYGTASSQYCQILATEKIDTMYVLGANGLATVNLFVKKGDVFTVNYTTPTADKFRLIYAQGNGSLYFYVGETVQNANLVNAGRIEEKLSSCITRNDCSAYIVETYRNGLSWYRVWSDGWCEQGGATFISGFAQGFWTVSLLKNYIDTEYNVQITFGGSNATERANAVNLYAWSDAKKVSSFNWGAIGGDKTSYKLSAYWFTCGYIR